MHHCLERLAVNLLRAALLLWCVGALVGILGGAQEIGALWYLGIAMMLLSDVAGLVALSIGVYLYHCVPCWRGIV